MPSIQMHSRHKLVLDPSCTRCYSFGEESLVFYCLRLVMQHSKPLQLNQGYETHLCPAKILDYYKCGEISHLVEQDIPLQNFHPIVLQKFNNCNKFGYDVVAPLFAFNNWCCLCKAKLVFILTFTVYLLHWWPESLLKLGLIVLEF